MRSNSDKNVYNALLARMKEGKVNIDSIVDTSVLPYRAQFIADPFIRYAHGYYHIFCEVYIDKKNKRIAHLRKDNDEWVYVTDAISGLNLSYPSVYDMGPSDEYITIIPQISDETCIKAYRYSLDRGTSAVEIWSIDLPSNTHDQIIVTDPSTKAQYFIFGTYHNNNNALSVNEITNLESERIPIISTKGQIISDTLFRKVIKKLLNRSRPRLTFRPAGDILYSDPKGFVIPIQATENEKYGEMFALVEVQWDDWKTNIINFLRPGLFGKYERTHHISWTKDDNGNIIFCCDAIRENNENRWELLIFK